MKSLQSKINSHERNRKKKHFVKTKRGEKIGSPNIWTIKSMIKKKKKKVLIKKTKCVM